jgi:polysaccharide deacetylase family protein (PEP-CTERM system associated)
MSQPTPVVNLLTFDIEGFIEASQYTMQVPSKYISDELEREEIEVNTAGILDVLQEAGQVATFFVLGRIARDLPGLVRRIVDAGHELGCHGFYHRRLGDYGPDQLRQLVGDAKSRLEDIAGMPVQGFRAPDFSITAGNPWVFDVLRELGFTYDSSVYPTSLNDAYGIDDFPLVPFRMPNGLVEFPMSTVRMLGMNVPFGGGGYLRLYPLPLTRLLFRRTNRAGLPVIVYFHPSEMGLVIRRIEEMPAVRKFRTYVGITGARDKLRALLRSFPFTRMVDYLSRYPVPDGVG